jgi:hypothetical protein
MNEWKEFLMQEREKLAHVVSTLNGEGEAEPNRFARQLENQFKDKQNRTRQRLTRELFQCAALQFSSALQEFVSIWLASGKASPLENASLSESITEIYRRRRAQLPSFWEFWREFDFELASHVHWAWWETHFPQIQTSPNSTDHRTPFDIAFESAAQLARDLMLSPISKSVGRCGRCKKYYVNRWGHRNKVYCRQRCATSISAAKRMKEKREAARRENIHKIETAYASWDARRSPNLKEWLAMETNLSKNLITRTLKGDLKDLCA